MSDRRFGAALVASLSLVLASAPFDAPAVAAPWDIFASSPKVEADRNKAYELTDQQGPWLILAGTFKGDGSREDALELLYELREKHSHEAFLYKVEYDYTQTQLGLGYAKPESTGREDAPPQLKPKKMRYLNEEKFDEYAVMIGNFTSLQDPRLDATLDRVKRLEPDCLKFEAGETTTKRYFGLRTLQAKINLSSSEKGPLRTAFATRNPLLPEEFFATRGVEPLIEKLNADFEYSLLDNPGNYTVRVATFKGNRAVSLEKDYDKLMSAELTDALHEAGIKAHELTIELRRQGVEAYEFHDYDSSIVTVGSYAEEGKLLPSGVKRMDAGIEKVVNLFKAQEAGVAGALRPKTMKGIPFDIQPWPMEVPRRSIAGSYLNLNR